MTALVRTSVVLAALIAAVLAGIGDSNQLARLPRTNLQPTNRAFSIWAIIYCTLLVTTIFLAYGHGPIETPHSAVLFSALLSAALVCCATWLLIIRFELSRIAAAAVLVLGALCALSAVALAPLRLVSPHAIVDVAVAFGPGLLAGWLALASVLSILIARDDPTQPASAWWLAAPLLASTIVGGVASNPAPTLALVWAAAFSAPGVRAPLAAAAACGAVGALAYGFMRK